MRITILCLLILFSSQAVLSQQNKPTVQINHTAIYVVDLKKSATFYADIIGLDTVPEPFHDGKHAWFKTGPHSMLHIIQGADKPKEYYKNNHTCYSLPSLEAFVAKLKSQGISFEDVNGKANTITTRVDGVHQIWFRDPDGYWIEVNDAKE